MKNQELKKSFSEWLCQTQGVYQMYNYRSNKSVYTDEFIRLKNIIQTKF